MDTPTRKDNLKIKRYLDTLNRPFIAWDGEGVTEPDGHKLILWASSDGDIIKSPRSQLRTKAIFESLLRCQERNTDLKPIHIIFGGSYDVNMMLVDMDRHHVERLARGDWTNWQGYSLKWMDGKSLYVKNKETGVSVRLFDVASFWPGSFIKACDAMLGDDWPGREMIIEQKARRNQFGRTEMREIIKYNQYELDNLVAIANKLRKMFDQTLGLLPRDWFGPGAIASKLMLKHQIKTHMTPTPPALSTPVRCAFAGGRFETFQSGHWKTPTYEYDLNSAYPTAARALPSLSDGQWKQADGGLCADTTFQVVHVKWTGGYRDHDPVPFYFRGHNGNIFYPDSGEGWYWLPEVLAARKWHGVVEIVESIGWYPNNKTKPFAFVDDLYLLRQELKACGDENQYAVKTALNSLYGKTAQQVGWTVQDGVFKLPSFHQLEWAGYMTSYCRAKVFEAAAQNPSAVIAFETDAVFTTERLDLDLGDGLGQWKETVMDELIFVKSGIHVQRHGKEWSQAKTRGLSFNGDEIIKLYRKRVVPKRKDVYVPITQTRFVGARAAAQTDWARWRTWEDQIKELYMFPAGKRDVLAGLDFEAMWLAGDRVFPTTCNYTPPGCSYPFPLEWIDDMHEAHDLLTEMAHAQAVTDLEWI